MSLVEGRLPPVFGGDDMTGQSPYRLVTSKRGSPGLPFGWEIHDETGAEICRSPVTFRSRHEAIAEGEKTMRSLADKELDSSN
jgi:hypothetical protein